MYGSCYNGKSSMRHEGSFIHSDSGLNASKSAEGRRYSYYTSTLINQYDTSIRMGNKINSKGNSPVIRRKDSSANNAAIRKYPAIVEDLETQTSCINNNSLPLIKDRSNIQRPSSKLQSSTLLFKGAANPRRNSVDSGYHSSGKVCDSSRSSDSSSGGHNILNSNSTFACHGVKPIGDKRPNQSRLENGVTDIDKTNKNRTFKTENINSSILSTRTRENPQLLTRRSENPRDTTLSDKLVQTTLDNTRTRSHIGEQSMISRSPKSYSRNGLVGLQNLGNTCFMNSILQCLSHCKPLRDKLLNSDHLQPNSKSKMKGKLFSAFSELIQTMWSSKTETSVSPFSFKLQIQRFSPRFVGYEQQDSQEFLRFLLDGLHEDLNQAKTARTSRMSTDASKVSEEETSKYMWKQYKSRDNSLVTDLFCGQMISILTCTKCNHRSVTFDPFLDLSLPIPRASHGRYYDSRVTLMDCLKLFTKLEDLDGDEKPKCEKCKVRQKCKKQFKFQRFPKILVLHLKRFSGFGYRSKMQTDIEFPLDDLDLSQFSSDSSGRRSVKYKLFAVSNHSGSTYGGHYTAYCKHPESKEWHSFNDSRVSDLSKLNVHGSQAYVLFYEMEEDTSHTN